MRIPAALRQWLAGHVFHGVLLLLAAVALGGLLLLMHWRGRPDPAAADEGGWKAARDLAAFTVLDPSNVEWTGPKAPPDTVYGRLTLRPVEEGDPVADSVLAADSVSGAGRWLVSVAADSLLRLESGAAVVLVGWPDSLAAGAAPPEPIAGGQVVTVENGRAVVALPPDAAARAAAYQASRRLAVLRVIQ